eukprot:g31455.t1
MHQRTPTLLVSDVDTRLPTSEHSHHICASPRRSRHEGCKIGVSALLHIAINAYSSSTKKLLHIINFPSHCCCYEALLVGCSCSFHLIFSATWAQ